MERSDPPPLLIADAGPIIHLDEIDTLWILGAFPQILVPPTVWEEVKFHRPSALTRPGLSFSVTPVTASHTDIFSILVRAFSLDRGEEEALLLMQQYPDALFLTDDGSARFAALQLGFEVAGTVAMLIRAARTKQIPADEVISLLEHLPSRSTLYIRPALLNAVLAKLKKEFGK
jgi:predicted nucleic acid-binding protein